MCILVLAEDLEARAPKSSAQTKTPGNTPRVKARPTQEGRRGSRNSGSGMVGVEKIGSDGKPEVFSLFRAKRSSRKVRNVYQHVYYGCVLRLYCCTSIYISTAAAGKTKNK